MDAVIGFAVLLLVPAAIAAWYWRDRLPVLNSGDVRATRAAARQHVKALERDLEEQERASAAELLLEHASKARDQREARASKALKEAEKSLSGKVASFQGVTLYGDRIVAPDGTEELSPAVLATCDTAGNLSVTRRVTVTRVLAGGVIGGLLFKKKSQDDTRELWLLVEGATFASVIQCDPKNPGKPRQFAARVTTAGKQSATALPHKRDVLAQARQELQLAGTDRSAIVEAETEVRTRTAATDEPARAERQLDELEQRLGITAARARVEEARAAL